MEDNAMLVMQFKPHPCRKARYMKTDIERKHAANSAKSDIEARPAAPP
jgi:hypothetical protein